MWGPAAGAVPSTTTPKKHDVPDDEADDANGAFPAIAFERCRM
jgi:hypothetical protein